VSAVIKLSSPTTREFWEIPVLFEDAELLALDKPAGLPLSPVPDHPELASLMKLLHSGIAEGKAWATERGLSYLNHAHFLDAETSGVILLAKSKPAFVALANLFGSNQPARKYVALVQGSPKEERFDVNAKLAPHPVHVGMIRVDPKLGKKSQSSFEVIERFSDYSLVRCSPITDRPHQIRVHLQNSGLRVVGDHLYGGRPLLLSRLKDNYRLKPGREERPLLSRPAIHAEDLTVAHPVSGQNVTIIAPLPKDLTVALKYLRLYAK
jgi:RluA family pseudouridine synthase